MTKVEIIQQFKKKGYRITQSRDAILDIFSKSKKPLAADEIEDILTSKKVDVNTTTIYREIEFLLKEEIIKQIDFRDKKKRYEFSYLPHHHHLVCENCDAIQDVTLNNILHKEEKRISKENSFKIMDHSLEFYGLCKKCQ